MGATLDGCVGVQRHHPQAPLPVAVSASVVLAVAVRNDAGEQVPFRPVVVEDPAGAAVEQDVGDLGRVERRVDRHGHRAQQVAGEVDDVPLRAVGGEQRHPVAPGHAVRLERLRGPADGVDELAGGERIRPAMAPDGQQVLAFAVAFRDDPDQIGKSLQGLKR